MKKLISLLLSATLFAGTFATTVMAETATATIVRHDGDAAYNGNQFVLDVTLDGVNAESYTYQWYNATAEEGPFSPMYKEINPTYVLSNNDYETYIRCEVTPINNGVAGEKITSSTYYLDAGYRSMRRKALGHGSETVNDYKNNPGTYYVSVGGENILILDEYADSFYVITDGFKGWHTFGPANTILFEPNNTSNIGYWLNNDFLTSNQISATMQKYIEEHKWWVEPGDNLQQTPYSFNAKISLLSALEYGKYMYKMGWGPHNAGGDWWLRNSRPHSADKVMNMVIAKSKSDRLGSTNGGTAATASLLVRPTFYLNDDIFLNEKARIDNMGSAVKTMMVERYSNAEDMAKLETLYTTEELMEIGFDVSVATATISKSGEVTLNLTLGGVESDSYTYQWYNATSQDGPFAPIYKETDASYIMSSNDIDTYIKCEITPITNDVAGDVITSDVFYAEPGYRFMRVVNMGRKDTAETYRNNPGEYYVNVAGENILILDEYQDSFYAITDGFKGWKNFGVAQELYFETDDTTNIGYYLNNDFLNESSSNHLSADIQKYIPEHKWWVEPGDNLQQTPYSFNAKVALLSQSEYGKYLDRIGWGPHGATGDWWLRNSKPYSGDKQINVVIVTLDPNKKGHTGGGRDAAASCLVRPTFYLTDDIFLNEKANVSKMGSGIKEMFVERYSNPEDMAKLEALYTPSELKQIGFEVNAPIITSSKDPVSACATLTAEYKDDKAVSYEYKWFISDSEDGNWIQAVSQNKNTYLVANNDMNKFIKVQVTPVYADGSKGTVVEAENVINVTALGACGRTGYGDDREANKNNPTVNSVKIGSEEVLILDEYSDDTKSFYVISKNIKGRAVFDADNTTKFDPADSNNIASILNGALLSDGHTDGNVTYKIDSSVQNYIPTVTWWTEAGKAFGDYSVEAKIGLMSRSEYQKYWGKFGWDPDGNIKSGWWLRSSRPGSVGGGDNAVYTVMGVNSNYPNPSADGWGNTHSKNANTGGYYIRPTFWLSEDVFRNVKADVNTMGSEVKEMILRRYEKSELQGLYSEAELGQIGYEILIDLPQKYKNIYTKNEAAFNVSYIAQGMEDVVITYSNSNGTVSEEIAEFLYPEDEFVQTINMSKLPYGENDVTITMTINGDEVCRIDQKMYLFPEQAEENMSVSGVCIHPAQFRENNKVFELAKKLGFTRVRIDFPWSYIEGTDGVNDFALFDAIIEEAQKQGIELTPILCYNHPSYSDVQTDKDGINTETELAGFINYVTAVANRYPSIDSYEIWNEPNHPNFWSDPVNAEDYSDLVLAVSDVLYEINPDCTIYAGALDVSRDPEEFAETMFNKGLYNAFDKFSYHPYFRTSVEKFEEKINTYKNILISNGGFKELAATEFGFNVSDSDSTPETTRASEVVKAMVVANAKNTEDNYIFNIAESTYGIMNTSYVPNEIAYTVAFANIALTNARFLGEIDTDLGVSGYMYVKNNEAVSVYWKDSVYYGTKTISVPQGAKAYDVNGNELSGDTITLTTSPVYVIGGNANIQAAAENEKATRINAIKSKFRLTTVTKDAIMNSSLSEKDKSAALYMLYEANKVDAIYNSIADASDLTVPTAEYEAVDCGGNIYAEAALKLAKKYIDKNLALADSTLADKNNIIAANNAIAKDLIASAKLLANVSDEPAITNVVVSEGVLTFNAENIENADIWVATYANDSLVKVEKVLLDNLTSNVGNNSGKIFVWEAGTMIPVIGATNF